MGIAFNPFPFSLSIILFTITGRATYRFFKERADRIERRRLERLQSGCPRSVA
jgi:hypothetical protein